MKFILISPKNRTAYNFRGDLIKEIIGCGYEVIVTGPNRDNVEKIEALGARFVEIPMDKNGVNPFADLQYERALYKLFMAEKPDAVLGYTSKPVIYGSLAAKRAKVPSITAMITGLGYAFTQKTAKAKAIRAVMSILYKPALKCADTVIFQNPDDRDETVRLKLVQAEKCRVVNGSGVNMERFKPLPYPEQTTFFMLARVMYAKGIREYLRAAQLVKEKYPDVKFMLLGACEGIQDSISREALQKYIDDGTIVYYGETDNVAPYYGECSVFVLPSYREGTGRVILEAMATQRPIIATDVAGCRETVRDGVTGFLVPAKDSEALAEKMIWFIEHPEKIPEMGKASLAYCEEKYDVRKVNANMLKFCRIQNAQESKNGRQSENGTV